MKLLLMLVAAVVVIAGVAIAGIIAFSDDDDSEGGSAATPASQGSTGSEGGPTAEAVLQQAAAKAAEVESFHFVLTHENGSTPLPLNLGLESAEGDVAVPDRLIAEVEADAVGINVSVEVIGIEDRTWITNPFTRQWQELPNTSILDFANPAAMIQGVLPSVRDAELGDGGSVGGVETHLVTGTVDSGALQDALGIAEPGRDVDVEAWIGVDDLLTRRVRITGALSDADSSGVVRQVELSRFNEPVEIMPPE